jgi:hypothetical protein
VSTRSVSSLLILVVAGPAFAVACGASPAPPAPAPPTPSASASPSPATSAPAASAEPAASSAAAETPPPSASAAASAPPPCPGGEARKPDGNCPDAVKCIDGEIMMGACICSGGKGVDATGHCVYMPCPAGNNGGTVFRNTETGQCMECRPGTRPCGNSCCPR